MKILSAAMFLFTFGVASAVEVPAPSGGNDAAMIQEAINTAPVGCKLVFKADSTYKLLTPVTVTNKRLTIAGAGNTTILIDGEGFKVTGANSISHRFTAKSLIFAGDADAVSAIDMFKIPQFKIVDCEFSYFDNAVVWGMATGGTITESSFWYNRNGIKTTLRGEYLIVSECQFTQNQQCAVLAGGNFNFQACNLSYNTAGIKVVAGDNNAHSIIGGCFLSHVGCAFDFEDFTSGMLTSGCHLYDSGVKLTNTAGVKFANTFFDHSYLTIANSIGITFSGCTFPGYYANSITTDSASPDYVNCTNLTGDAYPE